MTAIHTREPIMLEPDAWAQWLDHNETVDLETPSPTGSFRLAVDA
ncbi:hypothetical protein [Asticcacaulis benevestitus]|uniref:Abasic site processing protein n=1 Tax=Asticcacaulis benevestitus DSM 16100 = ATCC BAA-896 TaxID=1121022 RepID=V4PVV8_9CAUL|nr:hypothetical protein [Asticcacaulis benevestitus]ESQ92521.1 hypothetical protein ABENE_07750 [Asticcacaulis benevestitus DSM 16100 = ATCC BAA-896]